MQAKKKDVVTETHHVVEHFPDFYRARCVFKANEYIEICPVKQRTQPQAEAMHEYEAGPALKRDRFLKSYLVNHCKLDTTKHIAVIGQSSCVRSIMWPTARASFDKMNRGSGNVLVFSVH